MASFIGGIGNTIQGLFQSILAVVQAFLGLVLSNINGLCTAVWAIMGNIGGFIGASAQFVYTNYIVVGIITLVFICYQDRKTRGAKAERAFKRQESLGRL